MGKRISINKKKKKLFKRFRLISATIIILFIIFVVYLMGGSDSQAGISSKAETDNTMEISSENNSHRTEQFMALVKNIKPDKRLEDDFQPPLDPRQEKIVELADEYNGLFRSKGIDLTKIAPNILKQMLDSEDNNHSWKTLVVKEGNKYIINSEFKKAMPHPMLKFSGDGSHPMQSPS